MSKPAAAPPRTPDTTIAIPSARDPHGPEELRAQLAKLRSFELSDGCEITVTPTPNHAVLAATVDLFCPDGPCGSAKKIYSFRLDETVTVHDRASGGRSRLKGGWFAAAQEIVATAGLPCKVARRQATLRGT